MPLKENRRHGGFLSQQFSFSTNSLFTALRQPIERISYLPTG
ncbi:BarA sensory histidine kinase (VarS GacS) [Vibrio vulnificus MO6-24/O]|nr:BarA sensory histidine kinase (VarS GacS) [Vibrio vulnificus MO6-24/O]